MWNCSYVEISAFHWTRAKLGAWRYMWTASLGKQVEEPNDFSRIKSRYRISWGDWEVQWATLPWLTITILKNCWCISENIVCCLLPAISFRPNLLKLCAKCRQTMKNIVETRTWKTKETLILSLPCSFFNCNLWSLYITAKSTSFSLLRYFEGYFTQSFGFETNAVWVF